LPDENWEKSIYLKEIAIDFSNNNKKLSSSQLNTKA
jgi:hypothetical protein